MQNTTQVRGIHQGLVIFAQANNQRYPGVDRDGNIIGSGADPAARFQILLEGDYLTGDYAASPLEDQAKVIWTHGAGTVTTANFSYSLIRLTPGEDEWKVDEDETKAVVSDRPIRNGSGADGHAAYRSVHTHPGLDTTHWKGSVTYNDGHAELEPDDPGLFDTANGFAQPQMVYSGSTNAF